MSIIHRKRSPFPLKRSRDMRKRSSDELSIEELLPDDMGYDADVEVLRPDRYEEVESESESEDAMTPQSNWHSVDEELAARMKHLGSDRLSPLRSHTDRGRKRRSVEMDEDELLFNVPRSPDFEVQEVVDTASLPSPAKRRRKKSRRRNVAQHIFQGRGDGWTDSSERAEGDEKPSQDMSTSSTPPEQVLPKADATTNGIEDDEMMDMT